MVKQLMSQTGLSISFRPLSGFSFSNLGKSNFEINKTRSFRPLSGFSFSNKGYEIGIITWLPKFSSPIGVFVF